MTKKVFQLITGVMAGVAAVTSAVIVFTNPPMAALIVASVNIVVGAVTEICTLFIKKE